MNRRTRYRAPLAVTLAPPQPEPRGSYTGGFAPVLLAENARTLAHNAGPCARCGRALLAGQRAADLPGSRAVAHLGCLGGNGAR